MTGMTTSLTEAQKRYRELLEGDKTLTEFTIRFPQPHRPHVFKLRDRVVFTDRGRAHSGPIAEFERYEGKVYVAVESEQLDGGRVMILLAKVLFEDHPDAAAMLAPKPHLPLGTLVRVSLPKGKTYGGIIDGDLAVVLADKGEMVNVAKLGGAADPKGRAGDPYGRFPHARLTVVTVDPRTGAITE